MKFTLYPASKLDAKIAAMFKSGQRLQAEMHKIACSVLAHLGETKDIRVTMKFITAMPDMARTNGLKSWFEKFGPIAFTTIGEGKDAVTTAQYVRGKATRLGDAIGTPFWKFKATEGVIYEPLVFDKYIDQQIAKLVKDIIKVPADDGTIDPRKTLLDAMRAMKGKTATQTNAGVTGDPLA